VDQKILKPPKSPEGGLLGTVNYNLLFEKYLNNLASQTPFPFGEGMRMGLIITFSI
jgi:hypothetical protein